MKWETQEFLNKQAIERVGDPELRKGIYIPESTSKIAGMHSILE